MERWFSQESGMSNGELLLLGLVLFIGGRVFAAPDPETIQKAFALGVGVGAGAESAASEATAAETQQPTQGSNYEPPQFGGYGYGFAPYGDGYPFLR